jgi:hypothetical protein
MTISAMFLKFFTKICGQVLQTSLPEIQNGDAGVERIPFVDMMNVLPLFLVIVPCYFSKQNSNLCILNEQCAEIKVNVLRYVFLLINIDRLLSMFWHNFFSCWQRKFCGHKLVAKASQVHLKRIYGFPRCFPQFLCISINSTADDIISPHFYQN